MRTGPYCQPRFVEVYKVLHRQEDECEPNLGPHFVRACATKCTRTSHARIFNENAPEQNGDSNVVRACTVEMRMDTSQGVCKNFGAGAQMDNIQAPW